MKSEIFTFVWFLDLTITRLVCHFVCHYQKKSASITVNLFTKRSRPRYKLKIVSETFQENYEVETYVTVEIRTVDGT